MSSSESNAVKWLPMGEIGEFVRGNGLQKKDFVDSGVGCIHYGEIYTYYGTSATETKSFVSEELALKLRKAKHGDLVIATTSENVEDLCKAVAWLGEEEICIGGHSCLFRHNQNPKFLTYLTQTALFSSYKRRYGQGVKVVEISCKKLETFELPIPSLAEQERIVAILDKYSSIKVQLINQLDREIELTLKQYEYYRDELLSFNDSDIEFKALGDIAFYPKARTQIDAGGIYIGVEELLKNKAGANQTPLQGDSIQAIQFNEGDVLIGNIRPYLKKIWLANTTGGTNGDVIVVRVNSSYDCLMNRRFLYFILSSDKFFTYANQYAKGAKMPRGDKAKILEYPIPMPSLEEQERIVAILDKYSESVDKLVSNLRREKELVQKQYEYYREKLLTF